MKCSKIFKHFHRNGKYCLKLTNFFGYFYWKLQKHSTRDNVVENLIQQLVFLPQEILQCGGRKSILMKVLVSLCLKTESPNNERVRHKLKTFKINGNQTCCRQGRLVLGHFYGLRMTKDYLLDFLLTFRLLNHFPSCLKVVGGCGGP